MNTSLQLFACSGRALATAVAASVALAGCASTPLSPEGSADVRAKLSRLQADPNLGSRAPVAVKEAEAAVQIAEQPLTRRDAEIGAHRIFMADRKVEIAIAQASTRYAEDQRDVLGEERATARLDARTREADQARADADAVRASAATAAADAKLQAEELQRQIDALQAEATDRGLVLTLGDVLFATGHASLRAGGTDNLNRLVVFLNHYPQRNAAIVGHTDNVGSDDANQGLSQRRAEAVRYYLMQQGIAAQRLVASGLGERQPVADNTTDSGRQQNRRVEVIIDNPPPVSASM